MLLLSADGAAWRRHREPRHRRDHDVPAHERADRWRAGADGARARPTAHLAAEHIHQRQEERFEVIEGLVRLRWAGQESLAGPGETVVVPAGSPHSWAPEGDAGARVRLTFTPGAGIEEFFDEFFRLGREGRTNAKGLPSPFVAARLGLAHEMFFAGPPVPLQRAFFRFVAGVGKVIGRD